MKTKQNNNTMTTTTRESCFFRVKLEIADAALHLVDHVFYHTHTNTSTHTA